VTFSRIPAPVLGVFAAAVGLAVCTPLFIYWPKAPTPEPPAQAEVQRGKQSPTRSASKAVVGQGAELLGASNENQPIQSKQRQAEQLKADSPVSQPKPTLPEGVVDLTYIPKTGESVVLGKPTMYELERAGVSKGLFPELRAYECRLLGIWAFTSLEAVTRTFKPAEFEGIFGTDEPVAPNATVALMAGTAATLAARHAVKAVTGTDDHSPILVPVFEATITSGPHAGRTVYISAEHIHKLMPAAERRGLGGGDCLSGSAALRLRFAFLLEQDNREFAIKEYTQICAFEDLLGLMAEALRARMAALGLAETRRRLIDEFKEKAGSVSREKRAAGDDRGGQIVGRDSDLDGLKSGIDTKYDKFDDYTMYSMHIWDNPYGKDDYRFSVYITHKGEKPRRFEDSEMIKLSYHHVGPRAKFSEDDRVMVMQGRDRLKIKSHYSKSRDEDNGDTREVVWIEISLGEARKRVDIDENWEVKVGIESPYPFNRVCRQRLKRFIQYIDRLAAGETKSDQ
jgi:hypothetical protein